MRLMLPLLFLVQAAKPPTEAEFKKAEEKLSANADDKDAHLVSGRYLAFVKDDWGAALPHLANGSDAILKTAAEREAKGGDTIFDPVQIGDAWIAAAGKRPAMKLMLESRATYWYAKAWDGDLGVLWKDRLRERLRKLAAPPVSGPARAAFSPEWVIEGKAALDGAFAHSGRVSARVSKEADPKLPYSCVRTTLFTVKPGQKGTFSAWVMTDGTDGGEDRVTILFHDDKLKVAGSADVLVPGDEPWWRKVSGEFTVPAGATRADFRFWILSKKGSGWVDDVCLTIDGRNLVKDGGFEESK